MIVGNLNLITTYIILGLIEIRKLMPQEYMIDILPSHYNVLDSDKIKAIILENCEDFVTNTQRKVVFVIA